MDEFNSLKETYPQKFCLKLICRMLYYFGCGDCWYEKKERSKFETFIYPFWVFISNAYMILVIVNELLANLRTDMTLKENNDLTQHCMAHPSICGKVAVLYLQKNRTKTVLKRFLEDTRSVFSSSEIDKAAVRKGLRYCAALAIVCYGTLFLTLLDGVKAHLKEGIPIRTEVTFYPRPSHSGLAVNILRFFMEFHWWYLVTVMTLVDCVSFCSLVFLEAKFKLLQIYFKDLRLVFFKNVEGRSKEEIEEEFRKRFIVGVKLHEDALWCATNVQYALGNMYSVQIVQSLTLLVMCLIKLVVNERTVMFLFANLAYIGCLILLTGCYMMAAGDITHEASVLSTSIFHCGWELVTSRDLRPLVVVAIQRSQEPVYMTAFGVIKLSYVNFISVLRSSYSFFAVMY